MCSILLSDPAMSYAIIQTYISVLEASFDLWQRRY